MVVFGCLPDIAPKRYEEFKSIPKVAPKEIEKIEDFFFPDAEAFENISDAHIIRKQSSRFWLRSLLRNARLVRLGTGSGFSDFLHQAFIEGKSKLAALRDETPDNYYMQISRGCVGKCSYCAIRKSIGHVKSRPQSMLTEELLKGLQAGYREIIVIGDDPGCYGIDNGGSLPVLLSAFMETCDEYGRDNRGERGTTNFHLKEIHPKHLIKQSRSLPEPNKRASIKTLLCPIQSANDRVLDLMQREHNYKELKFALQHIQTNHPEMTVTTQIIAGFPTETDDEFMQTLKGVRECNFRSVVVFPYDDKEGTEASRLQGKLPKALIRQRVRQAFRYFSEHGIHAHYSCAP